MAAFQDLGVSVAGSHAPQPSENIAQAELLLHGRWKDLIPRDQWQVFTRVIKCCRARHLDFAFGGAFATATYTGKWRDTKDMDLYILPQDQDQMKASLEEAGLTDYYPVHDYDPSWIYRSHSGDVIVDAIWAMANHRTEVDGDWLTRGPLVEFGQEFVRVIPPEELIWSKLYVLQRDRSDWPDVLNLVHATGPALDWKRLLERLGNDTPLLDALLTVFQWMCPARAAELPSFVWKLRQPVKRQTASNGVAVECDRVRLLDTRPWFRPAEDAHLC